ncbi:MAG TPA: hypothetical protein VL096_02825, partial [Pirellulaceae bacterium]|nr:hypothetical protein [Pirellulaceae bacterium]
MNKTVSGVVLGAGAMLVLWGLVSWQPIALAQRPVGPGSPMVPNNGAQRAAPSGELIALSFDVGGNRQQVTLVDPRTHMMSVYHLEPLTGEIALKSVRNVHWDLQMDEFNAKQPS